jgi:hypothetical protein
MKTLQPRWIIGRTITNVMMNPRPNGRGGTAYSPVITLDNNAKLYFQVDETEDLEYSTNIQYAPPSKKLPKPPRPHR